MVRPLQLDPATAMGDRKMIRQTRTTWPATPPSAAVSVTNEIERKAIAHATQRQPCLRLRMNPFRLPNRNHCSRVETQKVKAAFWAVTDLLHFLVNVTSGPLTFGIGESATGL